MHRAVTFKERDSATIRRHVDISKSQLQLRYTDPIIEFGGASFPLHM